MGLYDYVLVELPEWPWPKDRAWQTKSVPGTRMRTFRVEDDGSLVLLDTGPPSGDNWWPHTGALEICAFDCELEEPARSIEDVGAANTELRWVTLLFWDGDCIGWMEVPDGGRAMRRFETGEWRTWADWDRERGE